MKGLLTIIVLLFSIGVFAQAPQALNYQGVARDNSGNVLSSQALVLQFSIRQASAIGAVVYQETHNTTTDALGSFALQIGRGTATSGVFATIDWADGPFFLEVGMDATNSGTFTNMGTFELLSVPYALYSERSNVADTAMVLKNHVNCVRAPLPGEVTLDRDTLNGNAYQVFYNTSPALWESMSIPLVTYKVYVNGVFKKVEGVGLSFIAPFALARATDVVSGDNVRIVFIIHTETCAVKFEHTAVVP